MISSRAAKWWKTRRQKVYALYHLHHPDLIFLYRYIPIGMFRSPRCGLCGRIFSCEILWQQRGVKGGISLDQSAQVYYNCSERFKNFVIGRLLSARFADDYSLHMTT
jgi:hypothetical protein